MRTAIPILSALLLTNATSTANNITVTNTSLGSQNTGNQTVAINFDVAWENSWRTSNNEANYDGAWIFVKFRNGGTSDWRHCTLGSTTTPGGGATLTVSPDSMGAFIHRSENGIGNISFNENQLAWHYGADGVLDGNTVEIKVFALEMVYIPQGEFYLGSGGSETNCFKDGSSTAPYLVTGPGPIATGTATGQLNLNGAGTNGTPIPASYPNGYNAFWIMKYEMTQQQMADFLNHLEASQVTVNNPGGVLNGSHPNFTPIIADRACDDLTIARATAFADWACLRPFSELEFEKACRGGNNPSVPLEYAWGTTSIVRLEASQIDYAGLSNESVNPTYSTANAAFRNSNGTAGPMRPVRVGIFARATGSNRQVSGATFYGVMNMSDNLREFTIYAGNGGGWAIDASVHGDGVLTPAGNTTITEWQSTAAFGCRGGNYNGGLDVMRVSNRSEANTVISNGSHTYRGIRLARTAAY